MENPLVIARAGTLEYLESYFEKAKHSKNNNLGCLHPFKNRDASTPQGRLLFLNNNHNGLNGNNNLNNNG
ncbi:MAG: hypothetical protein KKA65_05240 [Nanoarchaeota archaeon]|nr:hypothetical protein [Nanoarchaeota archaeon]MBU4456877.1 hypothetical protein [Nanoarchaeota archaeon]MCG2719852.1 hypothetical protein [Nanoarchaeota archaeon]